MNLVLDFGNTRIKAALFENGLLTNKKIYESVTELMADAELILPSENCIVCSVTSAHEAFFARYNKRALLFSSETPLPIKNLYKSSATLGSDRMAASIGSFALYPNRNVLTIDAGTCIKYNFVNSFNEFEGGSISPGLQMRLSSLHEYTDRLPLVNADYNYEKLTGQNTEESILSGCLIAAAGEIDGMIERYLKKHPNLLVALTGGDSPYLCKQVKSRIFAHPDLLLSGLNTILNFNLEK
jgi:type III pantothenate kinase